MMSARIACNEWMEASVQYVVVWSVIPESFLSCWTFWKELKGAAASGPAALVRASSGRRM